MNFSKPKTAVVKSTPVIRKTTVRVAVPAAAAASARQPDPNRFKLSSRPATSKPSARPTKPSAARQPSYADHAVPNSRKRKSATPQLSMFSDSEDDHADGSSDLGASDSDVSRKRIKSSVSSVESSGPRRKLLDPDAATDEATAVVPLKFIHGAAITSGKDAAKFENLWKEAKTDTVRLQYPARGQREKFELKVPESGYNEYQPLEDIKETIYTICRFYLPSEDAEKYDSEEKETGFQRRFDRAYARQDIDDVLDIIEDFNKLLDKRIRSGAVRAELLASSRLHLSWVTRILDQVYARTVSPKVESLKQYENGTDNVYGELLPGFVTKILTQTELTHDQVFIDLGSGVGNVVLQAALETGAESWGVEMMPNPCELARLQAREFRARTKLWGLAAGAVQLVSGDFTQYPENKPIIEVLKRADVVLVNNQAFTPSLNDKLRDMFLDLKDGCRVVSLKPFVPEGHKISQRNIGSVVNLFTQKRYTYFSSSVSWTDQMGSYYIATKDPKPLENFMRRSALEGRRA